MTTIPIAAEFLDKGDFNNTTDMMIEFAKLHVEAALKSVETKVTDSFTIFRCDNMAEMFYPLENIS